MKENKIYVDVLPCKISWTTSLLLLCIFAYIAAIVLCKLGENTNSLSGSPDYFTSIALGGVILSVVLWLVFFALFANACKVLPHKISTATIITVLLGAIAFVSNSISILYGSLAFGIITIASSLLLLGSTLWLGNILSGNYSGVLEEIGLGFKKIVMLIALTVIIMLGSIISGFAFYAISESVAKFITNFTVFCDIIIWIWAMWIMLNDVILPIYQMLNWGNQEGVTLQDLKNTIVTGTNN